MEEPQPPAKELKLYVDMRSPPCRSCLMLAELIEVKLEVVKIDIFKGEQHSEHFRKVNQRNFFQFLRNFPKKKLSLLHCVLIIAVEST